MLHIGKSSAGWCFSLHIYPEYGIHTWGDWLKLIGRKWIVSEYHRRVSKAELIEIVTKRRFQDNREYYNSGKHPYYKSWNEFLLKNGAEEGPLNSIRAKAGREYSRTVSHPADKSVTYTYHDYEFS